MFFFHRRKGITQPAGEALRPVGTMKALLPWHTIFEWFGRFLALVWLMKGLAAWATIFGVLGTGNEFLSRQVDYQAAVVFFAVIDVVAAVGLWMLSAWGGVVWLVAVLSYICIATLYQKLVTLGPWSSWLFGAFLVAYFVLAWLVAREPRA